MAYVTTTLIQSDYNASDSDHYIGVDCNKAITIALPVNPPDGIVIIIKAEMKPPLGNRRITILTKDESSIDGYSNYVIQVSNEFVRLVYRGNSWHAI